MSNVTGGCHCGAIRYQVAGELIVHALCHCSDCRRHAGAPVVGWTMYAEDAVKVTKGQPKVYKSSSRPPPFLRRLRHGAVLHQCEHPTGIIDIQSATYDDPDAVPAMVHIQTAERLGWMSARKSAQLRTLSAADMRILSPPRFASRPRISRRNPQAHPWQDR